MQNQSYISHHGILGMKWGKRNGPPYPLGVGDHSASEKKAGWTDSLKKESQKKIAESVKGDVKLRNKKRFVWGDEFRQGTASQNKLHYSRYSAIDQDKLKNNPHIQKAYKDLESSREDMLNAYQDLKDYDELPYKERKRFKIQAADEFYPTFRDRYNLGDDTMVFNDGSSMPTKEYVRLMFTDDDWDQGGITDTPSFDKYLVSKGKDPKEYVRNTMKANNNYREAVNKYVDDMVGEFGDEPIHKKAKDVKVRKAVYDAVDQLSYDEFSRRIWGF